MESRSYLEYMHVLHMDIRYVDRPLAHDAFEWYCHQHCLLVTISLRSRLNTSDIRKCRTKALHEYENNEPGAVLCLMGPKSGYIWSSLTVSGKMNVCDLFNGGGLDPANGASGGLSSVSFHGWSYSLYRLSDSFNLVILWWKLQKQFDDAWE